MSRSPSIQRRVSSVPASSTVSQVLPSQELSTNVVLPSAGVETRVSGVPTQDGRVSGEQRTWKLHLGALADTEVGREHAAL